MSIIRWKVDSKHLSESRINHHRVILGVGVFKCLEVAQQSEVRRKDEHHRHHD